MIATWPAAIAAFLVAAAFFTIIGLPLARVIGPAAMPRLALAPSLGWAVHSVVALPVLTATGFGRAAVLACAAAGLALAAVFWRRGDEGIAQHLPRWSLPLAVAMALLPAMAIIPKAVPGGMLLAPPMFDHVKIAVVDAILRGGLPVMNPFFGADPQAPLAYYYLWHFSAAVLASLLHCSGWAAEAAMCGFTAYASILLVIGAVVGVGGGRFEIVSAALLLLPGSMRPVLAAIAGEGEAGRIIAPASDIGGWLNQAAWVPQHLASACSMLAAVCCLVRLEEGGGLFVALVLGVLAAASFESSVWIGGVAFAAVAAGVGFTIWRRMSAGSLRFAANCALGALLAFLLAIPFLVAEWQTARLRGTGAGMELQPYAVFGQALAGRLRLVLDVPAFWFVLLPFTLPAIVPLSVATLSVAAWRRHGGRDPYRSRLEQAFCITAGICLAVAWLFRSTIDNNDLGWRACLPAILLLAAVSARNLGRLAAERRIGTIAAVLAVAALGIPDGLRMVRDDASGQRPGDAAAFAASAGLWHAVREYSRPSDRIASNPSAVALVTPWPVNIGWATLSDRSSCYAGWSTVIAYGPLTRPQLTKADALFQRVFTGAALAGDVELLAQRYGCSVAVVSRNDGAWSNDAFETSPDYRLAEQTSDWRIYSRLAK